ncbi:MAG: hypothetical protein JKY67_18120, partial [Pseudomonadales bacterium]|nr:hypothetical protein [Pseudomonadales bacterium]
MKLSLKSQILIPFIALIILTSIALIGSVLFAIHNTINEQAEEALYTGKRVFERLMSERGSHLVTSSEILVSDFGFKAAIASADANTILSALKNYQKRINVDVMMIHRLDGRLISTTGTGDQTTYDLKKDIIFSVKENGSTLTTLLINNSAYQVAILPVMAPTAIAWATIGVSIDYLFANELKTLTDLDISFSGSDANNRELFHISTLASIVSIEKQQPESKMLQVQTAEKEEYLSLPIVITANNEHTIRAYVYSSLSDAYAQYTPLKWQILIISLFALLFSIIGALLISKNIARPIVFFAKAARKISDGDYNKETSKSVQNSQEMLELEESFKKMQTGIAERELKILHQAYYDNLTGLPNRS